MAADEPLANLDLTTRGDARLLETATQRWELSEKERRYAVVKLLDALTACNSKKPRTIATLVRTLSMLEHQNQADEHKALPDLGLNVSLTPEQLSAMSDEELDALERRIRRGGTQQGS